MSDRAALNHMLQRLYKVQGRVGLERWPYPAWMREDV